MRTMGPRETIALRAVTSCPAPSRSALFTTKMSAISRIPAFIAWTVSPDSGTSTTTTWSAIPTTSKLGLAHADRLYQDQAFTHGLKQPHSGPCDRRESAVSAPGGHAADEDVGVDVVGLHPDAVAQDGPAGKRAGRVDGEYTNRLFVRPSLMHETIDQCALARAGRTSYTDDARVA